MVFGGEYDAAMLEESSPGRLSSSEEVEGAYHKPRAPRARTARAGLLVLVAALAVAGTLLLMTKGAPTRTAANAKAATVLSSSSEDPCEGFPHLNMSTILRNNLGRKGPGNSTEEGMIFSGVSIVPGEEDQAMELHINALTDFDPEWVNTEDLGFSGHGNQFKRVNLRAGKEVTLRLAAMKPGTNELKTLPKATFTFFDFDSFPNGENKEYIKVKGTSSTITYEGTELIETDEPDGLKVFTASKPGYGDDNPTSPLNLTEQQLQRAVTLIYEPFTEITITLGSTSGDEHNNGRKFDFVGRPSLQCATGVEPEKVIQVPTAPLAPTPNDEPDPTCCMVKFGYLTLLCSQAKDHQFFQPMC